MLHVVETSKTPEAAGAALEAAVAAHGFAVLNVHDLQAKLGAKGFALDQACRVFDVCSPAQAHQVLSRNMAVNVALPCRISVYQEGGRTKIGMIKPSAMLALIDADPALAAVAAEVDRVTMAMIADAA